MSNKKESQTSGVNFLSTFLLFSIGPILSAAFAFIGSIVAAWIVSPDDLGKVSLFTTAITILGLFANLGLNRSYMREFSLSKERDVLLYNCLCVSLVSAISIALLIIIFKEPIASFLFDNADFFSVFLLAIVLPFLILESFGIGTCRLYRHVKKYAVVSVSSQALFFLFIVLFYNCSNIQGYRIVVYARVLSYILTGLIAFVLEKEHYHFFGKLNFPIVKTVLSYGVPYMPALICSWLLHSMDKYTLRIWSTYTEIGFYASAYTIVSVMAVLRTSFSSFWTPMAYRWHDEGQSNTSFEKVGYCITVVVTMISAVIILFRKVIFEIYKPEYAVAADFMPFMLFVLSMETISLVTGCGVNLKKKTIYNLVATVIACVVNLIGNYLLIPPLGGLGASISTGISCIVYMFVKMMISRMLWYKFSMTFYIVNTSLAVAMSCGAVFVGSLYLDLFFFLLIVLYDRKVIKNLWTILFAFLHRYLHKKPPTAVV